MTTTRRQQLLFLTTLSVYLGLVLAGASPQVLTQGLPEQRFDPAAEIEREDDLDPNSEQDAGGEIGDATSTNVDTAPDKEKTSPLSFLIFESPGLARIEADRASANCAAPRKPKAARGADRRVSFTDNNQTFTVSLLARAGL